MTRAVTSDKQSRLNADRLESALAQKRDALGELPDDAQRSQREGAIEQLSTYVSMLRDTTTTSDALLAAYGPDGRPRRPFAFKLEFEDGRWNVDEKELEAAPCVGDIVSFGDGRPWRVRASQLVRARPARKPVREVFICAPAA